MNRRIYAVIVTYNPELKNLNKLVTDLSEQNCHIVVVDNSNKNIIPEDLFVHHENCKVFRLGKNEGIAKAQNIGIKHALDDSANKIIFFDQDSCIQSGFIEDLAAYMDSTAAQIVGPAFIDRDKSHYYPICNIKKNGLREKIHVTDSKTPFTTSVTISSGTMVSKEVFEIVGLMDEGLFIDYVDTEWCLRCFKHNILVHIVPGIKMIHAIGDKSIRIAGVNVPVHSPLRRYYRVRNAFLLLRNRNVPLLLTMREIVFSFIHTVIIVCTQKNKKEYIKYYVRALIDGIKGVKGGYGHNG